ncbi:hypothetical protein MMC28_008958 [Mycoblastus sanguinarius]|nr:hypothetical protein [Mycoblastus sanguinarius]
MPGKYIPPHMRGTSTTDRSPKTERKPEDGYTLEEIAGQFGYENKGKLGTLNSDCDEGSQLGFVIVFKDQHPGWPPSVFCKTNLHLLPRSMDGCSSREKVGIEGMRPEESTESSETRLPNKPKPTTDLNTLKDSTTPEGGGQTEEPSETNAAGPVESSNTGSDTPPYPVFTESKQTSYKKSEAKFLFAGTHHIISIKYLQPRSEELIAMLQTKFTGPKTQRSAEKWQESLSLTWADVELHKFEGDMVRGNPMVLLKEVQKKKEGVNELLDRLRLGGKGKEDD